MEIYLYLPFLFHCVSRVLMSIGPSQSFTWLFVLLGISFTCPPLSFLQVLGLILGDKSMRPWYMYLKFFLTSHLDVETCTSLCEHLTVIICNLCTRPHARPLVLYKIPNPEQCFMQGIAHESSFSLKHPIQGCSD